MKNTEAEPTQSRMFFFSRCTIKRKASVVKFLQFEERFRKLRFLGGLVWTVGLNVEIKLQRFNTGGTYHLQKPFGWKFQA